MKLINLLDFLNNTKDLYALDYADCNQGGVNLLNIIIQNEQLTQKINLGTVYVESKTLDQITIVDGLNRMLSLSLLLHAICECYKKTSSKNDSAIMTIRKKYLLDGERTKLKLPEKMQNLYNKIIFGEKLSGKEKESAMFKLLHDFWIQIKEDKLQAGNILKMLKKVFIVLIEVEGISNRELYYILNKDNRELNQLALIENYLKSINLSEDWNEIKKLYKNAPADLNMFFQDLFITKFNFDEFPSDKLYEVFVNYFETMLKYMSDKTLIEKIKKTANLYHQLININIKNNDIRQALIQIKIHKGEDTYAYILSVYEDYIDNNISEVTFLEILSTIDDYLKKRLKTPNNVTFNELITYLNAFITCK